MTPREEWIARARAVPVYAVIRRHRINLRQQGASEMVGPCPKCGGDDRFAINVKKNVFNCRGCSTRGDAIELEQFLNGGDFNAACEILTGEPPPKPNGRNGRNGHAGAIAIKQFDYVDETGAFVFAVDRIEHQNPNGETKKTFKQKRPDPKRAGKWIRNVEGVRAVPYRLPQVIEAIGNDQTIHIVEGEKCADALWEIGVPATTNAGGAGKWRDELNEHFKDADVILLPDNDDAGWSHIHKVGAALKPIAKRVRVLLLPDLRPKGDIFDWLAAGHTREQLDELVALASDWDLPVTDSLADEGAEADAKAREDELLAALASAKGLEYHRQRSAAAKELGVSTKAIDSEVKSRRDRTSPLYGFWIVEPAPEPADGDSLLRDIIRRLRRHVICSPDDALAIALWVMFSWVHDDVATHSPILNITSAEPESGKSTTLGLITFLAPRCLPSVEISEAALYRSIELWQPSFAIDEFDSVLASEEKAALRSIINSGHTRGQGVVKCVEPDYRPQHFKTFCPKCIGMVGRKLPATTMSRCIVIELRRRKKDDQIERFTHKDDDGLADLRGRLLRWRLDNADGLRDTNPSMPPEFDNRRGDNWRVMFAIADLCGEEWGDKARAAALRLECVSDTRTVGVRLLYAIKLVFDQLEGQEAIGSQELIERLIADATAEWTEWKNGKPMTQAQLARLLKPLHIFPEQIRIGSRQIRGYHRSRFADVWQRYL